MKFRVTMKDPDTLHDAIHDAVVAEIENTGLPAEEQAALREPRCDAACEVAGRWFEYGEYLTVEIDTDAGTCVVVPKELA